MSLVVHFFWNTVVFNGVKCKCRRCGQVNGLQLVMSRPVWKFVNFWNLLDIAIIGLIAYKALLSLDHAEFMNPALEKMRQVRDVYHECYWVARREHLNDLIVGIVVLASSIKVRYHDGNLR